MIVLENVSKIYRMGEQDIKAADRISLKIDRGAFAALRGPSGSGKSTVMNILGCLDRPDEGKYWLDGEDVGLLGDHRLAELRNKKIGFIHQAFNLLPRLTALENVELPMVYGGVLSGRRRRRALKCLAMVGLLRRHNHLPQQLSGGQQQRVAIARALAQNPPLILADEPTGNLDSRASVEIMSILQRLNERGATVVLVTHDADVAEWAQSAIYFRDGKIGV